MYKIVVEDGGTKVSIDRPTKLVYEESLNANANFDIIMEDAGSDERATFQKGNKIYIYRNGNLEITGEINHRILQSNGFLRIQGFGYVDKNLKAAQAPANKSSDWSSLDSSGIVGDVVTNQPAVSANIINNQTVDSFRTHENQSCLKAISRFSKLADQDYSFDYANNEVDIEDHKGTTTARGNLNEGLDITNIEVSEDDRKKVEKVTVIGKGQGDAQVKATYDGGSFSQGDKEVTKTDKNITSDAEASKRAELFYNLLNSTRYKYSFDVKDIELNFETGDVFYINAPTVDAEKNVRIVSYKRVLTQNSEALKLEVRGTGERTTAENRLDQLAQERSFSQDANTQDQGTLYSITYTDKDICDSTNKAVGSFTLPSWVKSSDQILSANLQVRRVTKKFDVPGETDNSLSNAGITNKDAYTNAGITNQSSTTGAGITNNNAYTNAGVTNRKTGSRGAGTTLGPYSDTVDYISQGSWETLGWSITASSSDFLFGIWFANFTLNFDLGGGQSVGTLLKIRAFNDSDNTYYPNSDGIVLVDGLEGEGKFSGYPSTTIIIPRNLSGDDIKLQIYKSNMDSYLASLNSQVRYRWWEELDHEHPNDFNDNTHTNPNNFNDASHTNPNNFNDSQHTNPNDFNDANHKNPLTRAISTVSESSQDFDYELNANGAKNVGSLAVGDVSSEIDIKSDLSDPSSTRLNKTKIWPSSSETTVYSVITIKVYRED